MVIPFNTSRTSLLLCTVSLQNYTHIQLRTTESSLPVAVSLKNRRLETQSRTATLPNIFISIVSNSRNW